MYNFFHWVNPAQKKSFEFRDKIYDVSGYLNQRGFKKLNTLLK